MSWLTILPPILAIGFAIWKRNVIIALLIAIFSAELILVGGDPISGFTNSVQQLVEVFSSNYNTRILLFSLLIGALIHLIQISGGVQATVAWLTGSNIINSPRRAGILPAAIGTSIFIDTNMSVLTAGISSQSLFDRFKMSRARLAYIIDSTCAPISVLILLNGWGAAIFGEVTETGVNNPMDVMIASIGYNFYAWLTLLIVFFTVYSGKVFGPMKQLELKLANQSKSASENDSKHESTHQQTAEEQPLIVGKKRFMLIPLIFMVASILLFMFITGDGDLRQGSGSESVLWSISLSTLLIFIMLRFEGTLKTEHLVSESFKGLGKLLPLVTLVFLAFALSGSMKELKTAEFVASAIGDHLPIWSISALIFILAGFIAFTTGTSWGTFGILIPIAIPLAIALGIPPGLVLGAVLGGAVFGDHASPISDTTVISSLAAGCDHLEHVRTQIPYALFTGGLAVVGYLIAGFIA